MYQVNECWNEFYSELDPEKRRELYERIVREEEDDGANAFRKELMDLRYTDPRNKGRRVDNFIWNIVILPGYLRPMYLIKAVGEHEIRDIIKGLGLENTQDWDDVKKAAAYWEYRNAAELYLSTCKGPNYGKKFFGITSSSDEEKLKKTAKDFYSMTVTVPAKYGREEEMELFTQALKDTFLSSSSAAKRAWREEETRRKNKT